ncbi:hypothetical protein [Psychromonas antarctica]|uniref:hypothetical protein n=1 Tax=Psychromonas antarctica TaxID=67573 RepID=UPI001EE83043|nr:hypothetical protein [Psychromonas antarctica]MCG6200622.1 hypothetical protein [Psychromonas antarctica]
MSVDDYKVEFFVPYCSDDEHAVIRGLEKKIHESRVAVKLLEWFVENQPTLMNDEVLALRRMLDI